jgi:hypothetical protein
MPRDEVADLVRRLRMNSEYYAADTIEKQAREIAILRVANEASHQQCEKHRAKLHKQQIIVSPRIFAALREAGLLVPCYVDGIRFEYAEYTDENGVVCTLIAGEEARHARASDVGFRRPRKEAPPTAAQ